MSVFDTQKFLRESAKEYAEMRPDFHATPPEEREVLRKFHESRKAIIGDYFKICGACRKPLDNWFAVSDRVWSEILGYESADGGMFHFECAEVMLGRNFKPEDFKITKEDIG